MCQEPRTWFANNCLQNECFGANNILLMHKLLKPRSCVKITDHAVPQAVREWFDIFSWSEEQWSSDNTIIIIELGYCKVWWFASVWVELFPLSSIGIDHWWGRLPSLHATSSVKRAVVLWWWWACFPVEIQTVEWKRKRVVIITLMSRFSHMVIHGH